MSVTEFETGRQPCTNYKPEMAVRWDSLWPNEHECVFCRDGGGTVSFCENCNRDHHSNGYETCKVKAGAYHRASHRS